MSSKKVVKIQTKKHGAINTGGMELRVITPKTYVQTQAFEAFHENNLVLRGAAGTGKTFISLYLALREIIEYGSSDFKKVVVVRSAVQGRDQGFMPGSEQEKMSYFEKPYKCIVNELCGRGDSYDILKNKNAIEFISTSFLRGITLDNSIVIVDEMQNMSFEELDTIMTRLGRRSKIIFCGDYRQSDLIRDREKQGLVKFMKIIDRMEDIEHIEFAVNDIVRSAFVRQYIISKMDIEDGVI